MIATQVSIDASTPGANAKHASAPAVDWRLASARLFLDSLERQGVGLSVKTGVGGPCLSLDMSRVDPCYADALRDSAARYAPQLVQLLLERVRR